MGISALSRHFPSVPVGRRARAARAAPQHRPVAGSDATRSYPVTVSPRDDSERAVADRRQRGSATEFAQILWIVQSSIVKSIPMASPKAYPREFRARRTKSRFQLRVPKGLLSGAANTVSGVPSPFPLHMGRSGHTGHNGIRGEESRARRVSGSDAQPPPTWQWCSCR
jgi:hypothetical protein